MAKRRGNPNWGRREAAGAAIVTTIPQFEVVAKRFHLQPEQYAGSIRLRDWVRRIRHSKYVPEPLLEAWGFEIEIVP